VSSTKGHGRKRAILYARVYTDEQAKSGYSLPEQRRVLREHAAQVGYEIVAEIEDDGYSGYCRPPRFASHHRTGGRGSG
jgi:site-specific DNA recombinase